MYLGNSPYVFKSFLCFLPFLSAPRRFDYRRDKLRCRITNRFYLCNVCHYCWSPLLLISTPLQGLSLWCIKKPLTSIFTFSHFISRLTTTQTIFPLFYLRPEKKRKNISEDSNCIMFVCVSVYEVEKQCSEKRNIDFSAYKILWIKFERVLIQFAAL